MMNSNRLAAAMNGNFAGAFGNDEQGQNFKPNPNPPLKENLLLFRKDLTPFRRKQLMHLLRRSVVYVPQ